MKKWLLLASRLDNLNKASAIIARWAILFMLGIGLWNVIGRYLGVAIGHNLSSNRLIEAQWYLFDLFFLLGLGWTLQRQDHVRVDVLQGRWGIKRKTQIELLGTIFLLLPYALAVVALSIEPTIHSWLINEASPDPDGLPRYWMKSLIPLGFLLLTLQGISEAIRNWAKLRELSLVPKSNQDRHKENNFD